MKDLRRRGESYGVVLVSRTHNAKRLAPTNGPCAPPPSTSHTSGLFPRSTSMLEGHNGQDALRQHQRHATLGAFRAERLVVRTYVIVRADSTTAAERLFGRKPDGLIEHLSECAELHGRGRITMRRSRQPALALTG